MNADMNNHMKKLIALCAFTVVAVVGCAGADVRPLVDMKGVNQSAYESDLKDCQAYAQQQSGMGSTAAKGAAAGVVVGGLLGLVTGGNSSGIAQAAGAGAVIGGAGGSYSGNQGQETVVKRCLSGRGYKVLN